MKKILALSSAAVAAVALAGTSVMPAQAQQSAPQQFLHFITDVGYNVTVCGGTLDQSNRNAWKFTCTHKLDGTERPWPVEIQLPPGGNYFVASCIMNSSYFCQDN